MSVGVNVGLVCSRGVGPERGGRAKNEDNYLLCRDGEIRYREGDREVVRPCAGAGVLIAVADGMGGHDYGELASAAAVQALARIYDQPTGGDPELTLQRFLVRAHDRLHERARARGAANMGTTLTVAWLLRDNLYWAHVGDSRLYHFRDGVLMRLSHDHTRGEFAHRDGRSMPIDPGMLTQNFIFGSRGLGDDHRIRVDLGVDTGRLPLAPGDVLVLCSDGVSSFIPEHRIGDVLRDISDPTAAAAWLVDRSLALGSDDNATAVVVRTDTVGGIEQESDTWQLWDEADTVLE